MPPYTEPAGRPPAVTPWDRTRLTRGSSGGAVAAVAGGLVAFAHGTDGGGSIRIPAAACGLVGLKTTRGLVSRGPVGGDSLGMGGSLACAPGGARSRGRPRAADPVVARAGVPSAVRSTWPPRRPFTAAYNITGQPALSLPVGWGRPVDGPSGGPEPPVSVQLVGLPGADGRLLALGAQLHAAAGWDATRRPPLW